MSPTYIKKCNSYKTRHDVHDEDKSTFYTTLYFSIQKKMYIFVVKYGLEAKLLYKYLLCL